MLLQVLQILADGQRYTSTQLIRLLGITLVELEQTIKTLINYGIKFHPAAPYHYQLSERIELLDRQRILMALSPAIRGKLGHLEILSEIDSTNRYLLEQDYGGQMIACLAEYQTAGRGQQGRVWVSPYGSGLCLSVKYCYEGLNYALSGLTIALAVSVGQILREIGVSGIQLKWPNDVIWQGQKLAGILLENRTLANQVGEVVMGIGINVNMPYVETRLITQPWTDLQSALGKTFSRNQLATLLIEQCMTACYQYFNYGLNPFIPAWQSFDMVYGKSITLTIPANKSEHNPQFFTGIACGIDETGALLVQVGNHKQRYLYGEVSIRR